MTDTLKTICAHNAPGQALVAGRPVECRQCGAQIQPSPNGGTHSINAVYPGQAVSTGEWALDS